MDEIDYLNDNLVFDLEEVEQQLASGNDAEVQFDRPFMEVVREFQPDAEGEITASDPIKTDDYLARLNKLCAKYGANLSVRFYGYHCDTFDAKTLSLLPNIHTLVVNCIYEAENLEAISELENLSSLQLGVFELQDKLILHKLPLEKLMHLTLEETATKALDLSPLGEAKLLRHLRLFGHKKNIEAVSALDKLEEFAFNPAKGNSLNFLNSLTGLRALKFVLGGVESVEEVSLPELNDIAFTMVRGLEHIGDLQRFPALERFFMQDQPRVREIKTGLKNKQLNHIWIYNCPELNQFQLSDASSLESLHAVKTSLNLEDMQLPKSLKYLSLFSAKARLEKEEREAIVKKGFIPEPHPEMPFFYK